MRAFYTLSLVEGLLFLSSWASPCDSLKEPYPQARCLAASNDSCGALFLMHGEIVRDSLSVEKGYLYLTLLTACDDKPGLKKFAPYFARKFKTAGDTLTAAARAVAKAGEWKAGVKLLEQAYAKDPRRDYLMTLALVYMDEKRVGEAESSVEKLLQNDSLYAPAYALLGEMKLGTSKLQQMKKLKKKAQIFEEALPFFIKASQIDPLDYRYHWKAALIYDTLDQWDSACAAYRRAVDRDGKEFSLGFRFGRRLMDKYRFAEAIELFERVYFLAPKNLDLLFALEKAHQKAGNYEQYYLTGQERLADALPETLSVRFNLGVEYGNRGLWDKAIEAYQKVLSKNGNFEPAVAALAAAYLTASKYSEAIPFLDRETRLRPSEAQHWTNLGECQLRTGDTAAALKTFEKELQIHPRQAKVALFLGTYFYNQKNYEKCATALAAELNYPDPIAAARMRGGSLYHLEREPSKALSDLLKCVGTSEEDGALHPMLAGLYERTGDKKKAVLEYRKCLASDPGGPNAEYFQSRIRELGR